MIALLPIILIIVIGTFLVTKSSGGKTDTRFWMDMADFALACLAQPEPKKIPKKEAVKKPVEEKVKKGFCHNCLFFDKRKNGKIAGEGTCKLLKEYTTFRDGCDRWRLNPKTAKKTGARNGCENSKRKM